MKNPETLIETIFSKDTELVDGTDEIFELELAKREYDCLSKDELIRRSAYFKSVNGQETIHYRSCNLQNLEAIHKNSSFRTKMFFLSGKYSTGYATHSLFPYRGKFHPQFIRALLNISGIKPGDTVLDPMAGSSTLAVEANLLGIDAISVDLSPFCTLMGKVKTFSLDLDINLLQDIYSDWKIVFSNLHVNKYPPTFLQNENSTKKPYFEIGLLAYLDAVGFSLRSSTPVESLFPRVLERYLQTIVSFDSVRKELNLIIGKSKIVEGDVLNLEIQDESIDAIITSPPYSFAIDYVKNDQKQLEYLNVEIQKLRNGMIGLQGKGIENRLAMYFENMKRAFFEMHRVSKKGAHVIMIIGTNEIQTKGAKLEPEIITIAKDNNFIFDYFLNKPIKGMNNSMKSETILFFRKK